MAQGSNSPFQKASLDTFYEAYFQELASGVLVGRWQRIDLTTSILVASTATGSTVTGWALWTMPGWKTLWVIAAGVATMGCNRSWSTYRSIPRKRPRRVTPVFL
jgi:hypothetical protein